MTTTVDVRPEPFDGAAARRLLAALDRELDDRYAGADDIPPPVLRAAEFAPPRGAFVVAWEDTAPGPEAVGCGGLRPGPAPGTAEVKRMYVVPRARGRRIAERVLHELGRLAVDLGYTRLVLETGTEQPEAMRLYERLGWRPVAPFGHYAASPLTRCFGRDLP
ncbi:MAG TPA: GNAT family N-acetyltransferase [Mycobacteriales bacterium]|nr:GNAT family N-acetyltransferase [Mycobacteriales bacterium]